MKEEAESSFVELLTLVEAQQQRPDVLMQVLQLLLQCSSEECLLQFLISCFEQPERNEQQAGVVRSLRRLLRLIGGAHGPLSALTTEILINFTANETLAALMLQEYKDITTVLMENLKRQQQQQQQLQQGGPSRPSDDDVPLHLGVTLMLLSNITRHKRALEAIFSPHLPLPDYYLLPCVLLLYDAPRDPQYVLISCVLEGARDLLRYMPPLCQGPFLKLVLRLSCREQLHHLLLPTDHQSMQLEVEKHYFQQKLEPRMDQKQSGEPEPRPEEDCRLLLALCSLLYPRAGSAQRAKAQAEIEAQDAEEEKQRRQQQQTEAKETPTSGVTERQRLRFLHPAVDEASYGPVADPKARSLAVDCLAALATSPHAREILRWFGVYEVLRAVFCIEAEESIRDKVEHMVHLLVFSEEELQQQDGQLPVNQKPHALCGSAEMAAVSAGTHT